jgi:hypothetical protein
VCVYIYIYTHNNIEILTSFSVFVQRFFAVSNVLSSMVLGLTKEPSVRLLKHIIRCYLRLSENMRAREALRHCLPGVCVYICVRLYKCIVCVCMCKSMYM